jgi:hypothetical protein
MVDEWDVDSDIEEDIRLAIEACGAPAVKKYYERLAKIEEGALKMYLEMMTP